MTRTAPRSIDQYLEQLRAELAGEDPALLQDALYDAEEYLRAELATQPDRPETDLLEVIASTYGAPDEVAAAYRDTEAKIKVAMAPPAPRVPAAGLRRFFGVFGDVRAWTSLFFMFLSLATGIFYFTFAVIGVSLSAGLAVLVIGIPFFLSFIGLLRVIALGEGRLIEAMTGARMPRRPVHPGPPASFGQRILGMLRDLRTWTTLAYAVLMLPLGIAYFVLATVGTSVGLALIAGPLLEGARALGLPLPGGMQLEGTALESVLGGPAGLALMFLCGVLLLTLTMHLARAVGRGHARLAKALLVHG